jgi:hypothetical protein
VIKDLSVNESQRAASGHRTVDGAGELTQPASISIRLGSLRLRRQHSRATQCLHHHVSVLAQAVVPVHAAAKRMPIVTRNSLFWFKRLEAHHTPEFGGDSHGTSQEIYGRHEIARGLYVAAMPSP